MKCYTVATTEQAITIDKAKNFGCEVIQVSNGLIIKTSKSLSEIQSELTGSTVAELDCNDPELSKDAKLFAGIS